MLAGLELDIMFDTNIGTSSETCRGDCYIEPKEHVNRHYT